MKEPMWLHCRVEMQMEDQFAAGLPKDTEGIQAMLEHRQPSEAEFRRRQAEGEDMTPLEELTDQVAEEVGVEEEAQPGWATFKRDELGIYYEGRCVRGHIKDCANQLQKYLDIKALKAKVANRVYVVERVIRLWREGQPITEPDGTIQRFVQVLTPKGPRSSIKYIEYVNQPWLSFHLKVLNDGVISVDTLCAIFEYGSTHGMGQERSQDLGRYDFDLTAIEEDGSVAER